MGPPVASPDHTQLIFALATTGQRDNALIYCFRSNTSNGIGRPPCERVNHTPLHFDVRSFAVHTGRGKATLIATALLFFFPLFFFLWPPTDQHHTG